MGTYTANYQLYMPTIGEQGWGELINGNYQTIDTTMKSFSNRIGTLETETDALAAMANDHEERITTLEDTIEDTIISGEGDVTFASINPGYIYVPVNKTYGVPLINISKSYQNSKNFWQGETYNADIFSFTVPSTSIFKPTTEIVVDIAMTVTGSSSSTFTFNITDSVGNNVFSKGGNGSNTGTSVTGTISIVIGETYMASISCHAAYSGTIAFNANATAQYYI